MIKPDQPKGSIVLKKQGNRRYYYYERAYRVKIDPNATGKVRGSGKSRVVTEHMYLGTAQEVVKKLATLKESPEPIEVSNKQFGLPMALFEMAERIGLRDIINSVAPHKVKGISIGYFALIAAINRVGNHTSKQSMGKWYQKTDLSRIQKVEASKLNSKNFWYAYDHLVSEGQITKKKAEKGLAPNDKLDIDELEEILDDSKIEAIEKGIYLNLANKFGFLLDVILYDTTNFYNYHQPDTPNSLSQFGKNKQHQDDKRQVGLQLAILKDLGIPIFHHVYCGNINDATLLPTAIHTLVQRYHQVAKGTERLVLVFDKGNNSLDNISLIEKQKIPLDFVGALTPSQHKDLIGIPLSSFTQKVGQFLVHRTSKNVFGAKRTIIITYNEATFRRQNRSFERQMNRVMKEAKAYFETVAKQPTSQVQARMETFLKTQKIATSQALRFYQCKVYHNGWVNRLTLRRKRYEVALKKSTFGKKLLFSSLLEETTENILDYYKGAYQIEDTFHLIKDRNLIPYAPAYHWTDSKIRVHAFVCILALLLLRLLHCVAKENDISMSPKLLVEELQDITMVVMVYSVKKAVKMVSSRSTVQQRLFDLYDLQKYAPSG